MSDSSSSALSEPPSQNGTYSLPHSDLRFVESTVIPESTNRPLGGVSKRAFDLVASAAAIVVLLPLFLAIAIILKSYDGGAILYRHRRLGYNGRVFECLKFRTMVANSEVVLKEYLAANPEAAWEWEASHKLKKDPRVTAPGAALRKMSLDELPQLFNILKGEMSFVGPRPIVSAEVRKYGSAMEQYYRARPGLTGRWQISGRNDVGYDTRVALDRQYVNNWSISNDMIILIKTVWVVVKRNGCY